MDTFVLTEENLVLYAMRNYNNPHCLSIDEFYDDLKRIKYVKRLLNRYRATGVLKDRLIMNHIVILENLFGTEVAIKLLFHKLERKHYSALKTFLVYKNVMPDYIIGATDKPILNIDIAIDQKIAKKLREL